MNQLMNSAVTQHPLYEAWMNNWVFLDDDGVLTGYAPDLDMIAEGTLERVGLFLAEFIRASLRWTEEQIHD